MYQILHEQQEPVILWGMGGIGKTELALQYAWKQHEAQTYLGGICWVAVAGNLNPLTTLLSFAQDKFGLQPLATREESRQIAHIWSNWQEGEVLVIFDDVEDYEQIKAYLPPKESRFKVIITTRQQWLTTSVDPFAVKVLEPDQAIALLIEFIDENRVNSQLNDAQSLCGWLGYLPLGLELVARFLKRRKNVTLERMLGELQAQELDQRTLTEIGGDMTAKRGVAAAFEISWQVLPPEAQQLGCFLSLFALAPIPWFLVELAYSEERSPSNPSSKAESSDLPPFLRGVGGINDILEDIREDSLINLSLLEDVGNTLYKLHPLLRVFLRAKLEKTEHVTEDKQRFCGVMVDMAEALANATIEQQIQFAPILLPHLEATVTDFLDCLTTEQKATVYYGIGKGQYPINQHHQALERYQEALQYYRQIGDRLGEANTLQGIGQCQEDPNEALRYYGEAMELYQQINDKYSQMRHLYWFIHPILQQLNQEEQVNQCLQRAYQLADEIGFELPPLPSEQ